MIVNIKLVMFFIMGIGICDRDQFHLIVIIFVCRRHHKSDCMCAVCILKRRKRERHSSQGNSVIVEVSNVFCLSKENTQPGVLGFNLL